MESLTIKIGDGKDVEISVIDIVTDNETGKKYIFYQMPEDDDVYAAILKENDTHFILEAITDDNEWELVEGILDSEIKVDGDTNE